MDMEPMQMVLAGASLVAALGLAVVGALHVGWAAGRGRATLATVVPSGPSGAPLFRPPWWASLAVAVGLLGFAAAIVLAVLGIAVPGLRAVLWMATVAFGLRVIGDGRYVGLAKRHRGSAFARLDDRLYIPLSLLFACGSAAALML
jgi:hypothetical protein